MYQVVSTSPTFGKYSSKPVKLLEEAGYQLTLVSDANTEEKMEEAIQNADALIVGVEPVTDKVLKNANRLKVISKHGAGVDNIDLKAAKKNSIVVANAPGANKHAVADYVFGLLLSAARQIPMVNSRLKENKWKHHVGVELYNKTIGIIGTGRIGKEVIRRAKGFNMNILAYDLYPDKTLTSNKIVNYVSLDELFSSSDFVTMHIDLNEETENMVSTRELELMKETSILINTSRGGIVDEEALYEALLSKKIRAAAIDVFKREPLIESPLLTLDNFLGSPHTAGYTEEALTEVGILTAKNIIEVLEGREALYPVTLQGGNSYARQ